MEFINKLNLEAVAAAAVTTAAIVLIALVIWFVIARILGMLDKRSKVPRTVLQPIRATLRYGLLLICVIVLLSAYGIPIGNFWTFISTVVGLIAIGFVAVWSVLSNLSASFLLLLLQPFRVGEYVRIVGEDVMGRVIGINVMFTTVQSLNGNVFKVPNNQFFQKSILKPVDPEALEAPKKEAEEAK